MNRAALVIIALCFIFSHTSLRAQDSGLPASFRSALSFARPINLSKPEFPWSCKCKFGKDEAVFVVVETDSYGKVYDARAVSGHPILRESAKKAAAKSLFTPTKFSTLLIGAKVLILYRFIQNRKVKVSVNISRTSANPDHYERCSDCAPLLIAPIYKPKLEFPAAGRHVNATGLVEIEVVVNEGGNVEAAKAVSGHLLLRKSALEAAKLTRFSARAETPVRIRRVFTISYNFQR